MATILDRKVIELKKKNSNPVFWGPISHATGNIRKSINHSLYYLLFT